MSDIRPTTEKDLDDVLRIEQDPSNVNWICPYSRERHLQVISSSVEYHFVIVEAGKTIGFIILADTEKEHGSVEFRRIAIMDKGRGVGRSVVRWIKRWAFVEKNAYRLWLDVFTDNERAKTLYRSEGFVEEGVKRNTFLSASGRRSQLIMSVLRPEWENTSGS